MSALFAGRGKASGGGSGGSGSGASRASGARGPSTVRAPELVLRKGQWVLEGAEEDVAALEMKVPKMQARLLAAVKAEQVRGWV